MKMESENEDNEKGYDDNTFNYNGLMDLDHP